MQTAALQYDGPNGDVRLDPAPAAICGTAVTSPLEDVAVSLATSPESNPERRS